MREFQEKRYFRRIFFSRSVFFLFVILAILLSFSVFEIYKKNHHAQLLNEKSENDISNLEERRLVLEASIKELRTPSGEEEELRRKFQIKKPDEEFIVIIDKGTEQNSPEPKKEEGGFFKKILEFFGL